MSYGQNGTNGYVNGSHAHDQDDRYEEKYLNGGSISSSRARRAGGYGGFLNDNLPLSAEDGSAIPSRNRVYDGHSDGRYARESPDRGLRGYTARDRSRSRDRDGRDISNATTYGTGPGGRQIEG